MASTHHILVRNGTVLIPHFTANAVLPTIIPTKTDILITDNIISGISENITPPTTGTIQTIDATDKIVSPGFTDTHRHVWNTQLKGRHSDEVLRQYMFSGAMQSYYYTPEDVFWGQLSGALETIDAGTTLVVDHSHINCIAANSDAAIEATILSGLRSVYCYCPDSTRVNSFSPFELSHNPLPEWTIEQLKSYASVAPWGPNGRVSLGMAFDSYYLPVEVFTNLFKLARSLGVKVITTHDVRGPMNAPNASNLANAGLLGEGIIVSHATNLTPEAVTELAKSGAYTSSAPAVELQMQQGDPICLHPQLTERSSLGVDCATAISAYIPEGMRTALSYARGKKNQTLLDQKVAAATANPSTLQAFNLGTIQGARAAGLGDITGSIEVGKRADIVIFEALSPSMLCGAQEDPVAAIVHHSTIRDVHTVIVDGVIRKENGRLLDVEIPEGVVHAQGIAGSKLSWSQVARKTLLSSRRMAAEYAKIDLGPIIASTLPFDNPEYSRE
ncbi:hypothetical protein DFH27DRAFT_569415 [Peziza echinospora]|nr:hypothetical protein DFH27DRAFT_569415 [Peziza echinospora]